MLDAVLSHRGRLEGLLRHLGAEYHTAQDLAQDALLTALQRLPSLRDEQRLSAWLDSIAMYHWLHHHRKRTRERRHEEPGFVEPLCPSVEEGYLQHEFTAEVRAAVAGLRPTHAQAVVCELDGLTCGETARLLGVNENCVRIWRYRARRVLREVLTETAGHASGPP